MLPFPYAKKITFQSFLFGGNIFKSRTYSLDVSTDIPILNCILNNCISRKSRDFYQVREAHLKNCELSQFRIPLKNVCKLYLDLTLSWRKPLSYRNQSINLQSKSIDWFLYDNGLRLERVNVKSLIFELECSST